MKNILNYHSILIAIIFFSNPLLFAESDHNKNDKVKHPKALQDDIVGDAGDPMVKPSTTHVCPVFRAALMIDRQLERLLDIGFSVMTSRPAFMA